MLGSQEVDLASFYLFSFFIFLLSCFPIYFLFVLFSACRTKIRGGMSHVT